MAVKKSIAIIGEGETEWWYFETLRVACRLTEHGDLQRAIGYAEELTRLSEASPEDKIAYSQMHRVFELIASMEESMR